MRNLFGDPIVKALTWKEPFASLMLHGKIETRVWDTSYRGTVLICAGQTPYSDAELLLMCGDKIVNDICFLLGDDKFILEAPTRGMAIAIGELVNTRPMRPEDEVRCFVKYRPELFCHIYQNVTAIKPFSFSGVQGWKNVTGAALAQIAEYV